ncbi:MAG: YicC family protein [Proteobacteria bacterium]|nr:YicC family protein [Pseudomonadota bacterium]HQR04796.1 YicC family protein [Rhodocyclaceae bacterium]
MIHSMTGYAAGACDLGLAVLNLELKSVNSRYLDLSFRIGEDLRMAEMALRERITARMARGKVECRAYLQSSPTKGGRDPAPNAEIIAVLARLDLAVRKALPGAAPLSVAEVLRWPGVLAEDQITPEKLQTECLTLMDRLLDEFIASRAREGAKLADVLRARAATMRTLVDQVRPLLPQALTGYQERLAIKLRETVASLDEERIRQEIGVLAVRIDVDEELARLTTHLDELERILKKGGAVGKRLDFLMQELNREANTLASKSVSGDVTAIALELKLLIEQMREQVQNLE